MNKRRTPTLYEIEARWSAPSDRLLARIAENDPTVPESARRTVMEDPDYRFCVEELRQPKELIIDGADDIAVRQPPAWLLELADKRDAARRQLQGAKIQPGTLVAIERLIGPEGELPDDFPSTAAILLDGEDSPGVWHGWLAASETGYATDRDFILREDDGPFDPSLVGMVQLWNPARVYGKSIARIVGALPVQRLQAVRALASPSHTWPAGRPTAIGRTFEWETPQGFTVATGTPLQGPHDSRRHYQEVYLRVAGAVSEPARLAVAVRPWWDILWQSITASLQFEASPAIALAMAEPSAAKVQEGILAGHFRLRLDTGDESVMRLHLARIDGKGGVVRLTRQGETLDTFPADQAEAVFLLDQRPGYALEVLDPQGGLTERIGLGGAE